jgi:ketosteroid isomerase-like protein
MDLLRYPGRAATAAAAALVLGACSRGPDLQAARTAILDADVAFAQATASRGVDAWVEYFADSGVQVSPGRNYVGKAAIREHMAPDFADTTRLLSWRPTSVEVSSSGDLGYTIGRWEYGPRAGGPALLKGTYVTIWRKQAAGSWKVVLDVGNADPAPVPAAPARKR